jgi:hypothetical protein
MAIRDVTVLSVPVSDQQRSRQYYVEKFGLRAHVRDSRSRRQSTRSATGLSAPLSAGDRPFVRFSAVYLTPCWCRRDPALMETREDVDVVRVAMTAMIRRMTDDQINRVIGELEYVAEERGDRAPESVHGQAALHLIAALESRRERRNGHSIPPPSTQDAPGLGHEA